LQKNFRRIHQYPRKPEDDGALQPFLKKPQETGRQANATVTSATATGNAAVANNASATATDKDLIAVVNGLTCRFALASSSASNCGGDSSFQEPPSAAVNQPR